MLNIKTVTVIGANGTMGANISGIYASFGEAKVYMICRRKEKCGNAFNKARLSVKAEAIEKNLIPKTYDDIQECIENSDLVIESVSENAETKKSVYEIINKYAKEGTIIATGTSGLSINQMSGFFRDELKPYFLGIHMYNPPYSMTLCELIRSKYTDGVLFREIKEYLSKKLLRKVVEVKDAPAFMGNRIGFQFINLAMQYAERYKDSGGIDYIDSILGSFTGRSMAPLATSDFVGLDVHKAIVDNIYENSNDFEHSSFILPEFAKKLIESNMLGRKSGAGLYKKVISADNKRESYVYDIDSDSFRVKQKYIFPFAQHMKDAFKIGDYNSAFGSLKKNSSTEAALCREFLARYVLYSLVITKEIGEDIHSADSVMAAGFNWIPPLALIDAFGGKTEFINMAENTLSKDYLSKINIYEILKDTEKSHYDFRPFFKAK